MFSIIVPVYNSESTLNRCVNSILSQSCSDFELILVDDGSKDDSSRICDEYSSADLRVKTVHTNNCGVSSARNTGLKMATGQWISFVDSDDYLEQNFLCDGLDESVDLYVQHRQPFGNDIIIEESIDSQVVEPEKIRSFFSNNCEKAILRTPNAKFFKKSIIVDNGILFNNRFHIGEDTLFDLTYYAYVNKLSVIDTGRYMYYREADYNDALKYSQSPEISIAYLDEFWRLYNLSGIHSDALLSFMLNYFRQLSSLENNCSRSDYFKWITSKSIIGINKALNRYTGIKGHTKLFLLEIFAPIVKALY